MITGEHLKKALDEAISAAGEAVVEGVRERRSVSQAMLDEMVDGVESAIRTKLGAPIEQLCQALDLINTPETMDFLSAVQREAAHQRVRWPSTHDSGKAPADWFWLLGALASKAVHVPEKRLHHIITSAAVCMNWHLHELGKTNMRPGIELPEEPT